MADGKQVTDRRNAPGTVDITTVKQAGKSKVVSNIIDLETLFNGEEDLSSGERSTRSEPICTKRRNRKGGRTLVLTPQGKKFMSNDARLHLEKLSNAKEFQMKRNC